MPAVLLGGRLFAARWRRISETSPLEYIERRYGNGMRQGLMWLGLPMRVLDDAFKLLAIGTVVGAGMGFPLKWAIIVSGVIILSYTFLGGLWATLVAGFHPVLCSIDCCVDSSLPLPQQGRRFCGVYPKCS